MLSTSYEAFYAMDNLRHRAQLTCAQMAKLMNWDDIQYRAVKRKVSAGAQGGLNGHIDIKVRYGIALLILGLMEGILPVEKGTSIEARTGQRASMCELVNTYENKNWEYSSDPVGYIEAKREGRDQFITTEQLIEHARKFVAWT